MADREVRAGRPGVGRGFSDIAFLCTANQGQRVPPRDSPPTSVSALPRPTLTVLPPDRLGRHAQYAGFQGLPQQGRASGVERFRRDAQGCRNETGGRFEAFSGLARPRAIWTFARNRSESRNRLGDLQRIKL